VARQKRAISEAKLSERGKYTQYRVLKRQENKLSRLERQVRDLKERLEEGVKAREELSSDLRVERRIFWSSRQDRAREHLFEAVAKAVPDKKRKPARALLALLRIHIDTEEPRRNERVREVAAYILVKLCSYSLEEAASILPAQDNNTNLIPHEPPPARVAGNLAVHASVFLKDIYDLFFVKTTNRRERNEICRALGCFVPVPSTAIVANGSPEEKELDIRWDKKIATALEALRSKYSMLQDMDEWYTPPTE
jgi:hypothetical protein